MPEYKIAVLKLSGFLSVSMDDLIVTDFLELPRLSSEMAGGKR
jgi:hypothetical protein